MQTKRRIKAGNISNRILKKECLLKGQEVRKKPKRVFIFRTIDIYFIPI